MKIVGESFAGVATSATRVIELYVPENKRLFDDPYALKLLPFGWRVLFRFFFLPGLRDVVLALRERRMPGSLGSILCRTRYIDDVLKTALADGAEQVVILGAGFDSRAYRIAGMGQVKVFEVDLPGTEALKQKRLEQVLGAVPENVILVGIDFDHQNLEDELAAAGFQTGKRTFFIWEGVTQYLTAEAVSDTLEFVGRVSGSGSAIAFTYVRQGVIAGTEGPAWFHQFVKMAGRIGSPLVFGLDPGELAAYLAARELKLVADVGAADYQERYLEPLGRTLNVFAGERAALVVVQ